MSAFRLIDELQEAQRRLKADPADLPALLDYGVALLARDRHEEALAAWRKALEIDPDCAEAWYDMAVAYQDTGDLAQARACLNNALQIEPRSGMALMLSGELHAEAGQTEAATADFRKAFARFRELGDAEKAHAAQNALKALGDALH